MKRFFTAAALTLSMAATIATATSRELITRVGIIETPDGVEFLRAPNATLLVRLDLETEQFEVGPYARYAQRGLGVQAPLVAKKSTKIVDAAIALLPEDDYMADSEFSANLAPQVVERSVTELRVDISSSETLQTVNMATEAAEEIFWIRQLRTDILSGELGDGFYGGGLEAAFNQLEQKELKLTELFMGCTTRTRESHIFRIILEGATDTYRVCRFSETNGIADLSDISADLIVLSINALEEDKITPPEVKSDKGAQILTYRVAAPTKCELLTQEGALCSTIIPLFETGYDIKYVIPAEKK